MKNDNPALDACRRAFEEWYVDVFADPIKPIMLRDGEGYSGTHANASWYSWQSAWNTRPQPCGDAVMPLNVWTVGGTPKEIALKTMPKSDGLKAREFQNRIVEWYVNHFPTIEAALTQPKADVDLIKANVRAFRYPNGHSGVPDKEYMKVHTMDEQLIDHLAAQGYIGGGGGLENLQAPRMFKPNKGDWPEDFSHENGQYQCQCCHCNELFTGQKRRIVCKVCFAPKKEG